MQSIYSETHSKQQIRIIYWSQCTIVIRWFLCIFVFYKISQFDMVSSKSRTTVSHPVWASLAAQFLHLQVYNWLSSKHVNNLNKKPIYNVTLYIIGFKLKCDTLTEGQKDLIRNKHDFLCAIRTLSLFITDTQMNDVSAGVKLTEAISVLYSIDNNCCVLENL